MIVSGVPGRSRAADDSSAYAVRATQPGSGVTAFALAARRAKDGGQGRDRTVDTDLVHTARHLTTFQTLKRH